MNGIIAKKFGKKSEDILRNAMLAFDAGYAWPVHDIEHMPMAPGENDAANRISTDGNTMIALGLIAGGCRFGAGYPITPWTTIMEFLRTELPKYNGMFIQCEDELAAVSLALGASYSGHLAITGSSGPGLCQHGRASPNCSQYPTWRTFHWSSNFCRTVRFTTSHLRISW